MEEIVSCRFGNFFKRNIPQTCNFFRDIFDIARLVGFPTIGHGRQVRGIGFNEQSIQRDASRNILDRQCILEGDDTGQ